MTASYFLLFLTSFLTTLALTPFVKRLAFKFNLLDTPNSRKVHTAPIPRIGGLAMIAGFLLAILLFGGLPNRTIFGVITGSFILLAVGLLDDLQKKGIFALLKLVGQILAAWWVVHFFNVKIDYISHPLGNWSFILGNLSEVVSIVWIVAMTNMMNLIDGLDGLAAGVGAIAAFTLFLTAVLLGRSEAAILMIVVFGVCLGFLRYNFSPASIFMGDTGSMFLGYMLGVASIIGALKSTASFALAVPVLALGIPVFDTASSILRRLKRGQPIFQADGEHLHHKLIIMGLSHRQAVLAIYLASVLLCVGALLITLFNRMWPWVTLTTVLLLIGLGVVTIGRKLSNVSVNPTVHV